MTDIGRAAFCGCTGMTSVAIPRSVTHIPTYAFYYCVRLTDIYYSGSEKEWNNIEIEIFSYIPESVKIHYNSDITAQIGVTLNGSALSFDQSPVIINNRTMVPVRAIFEAMGYSVVWDSSTKTAAATKGSDIITVQVGNSAIRYVTNGVAGTYDCDTEPQILSDRTLVPARAIAESAGCTVDWDSASQTVSIKTI